MQCTERCAVMLSTVLQSVDQKLLRAVEATKDWSPSMRADDQVAEEMHVDPAVGQVDGFGNTENEVPVLDSLVDDSSPRDNRERMYDRGTEATWHTKSADGFNSVSLSEMPENSEGSDYGASSRYQSTADSRSVHHSISYGQSVDLQSGYDGSSRQSFDSHLDQSHRQLPLSDSSQRTTHTPDRDPYHRSNAVQAYSQNPHDLTGHRGHSHGRPHAVRQDNHTVVAQPPQSRNSDYLVEVFRKRAAPTSDRHRTQASTLAVPTARPQPSSESRGPVLSLKSYSVQQEVRFCCIVLFVH